MRCTDNSRRPVRSARARRARARRRRQRMIRRMMCLFLLLCISAAGIIYFKIQSKEETLAAEYEASNYNTSIYTGTLFSEDLCVAAENVSMEGAPDTGTLKSAGLFDVEGNSVNFAYNIHEKAYPASLTKLMTALVALDNSELTDEVTVSANADSAKFAADEATCGIKEGDRLTMADLLYGLLLHSGNDNAVAIAEHVGESVEGFADMMNEKAAAIMATNSNFVNPNGLHDENHYTTAYDMYLIFNECIKNEDFIKIVSTDTYTAEVKGTDGTSREIKWEASNFYAQGTAPLPTKNKIIGGKTGTTLKAGNCLVLLNESDSGQPYISIVMGADTKDLLYQDMTKLIEGF